MHKLLLIDDDKEMLELNRKNFSERGFEVRCAHSANIAFKILETFTPQCILLDVMMPNINGFDACKIIRGKSQVPIIFLTGRVSEDDKVSGLLLGADDYIEKPYSLRELEARIMVCIKRKSPVVTENKLCFPPLEIDISNHCAYCDGENINLSTKEYDLLLMLANSGGEIVTYEQIGIHLWGSYLVDDRRSIMVYTSRLRKKLEHNPVTARMIETVWSNGYRFVARKAEK